MPDTARPPTILDVLTVLGTKPELIKAISLARFSATLQADHGDGWISGLSDILDALDSAATGIVSAEIGSFLAPAPSAEESLAFIAKMRDLSLSFKRESAIYPGAKYRDKGQFRQALLMFVGAGMQLLEPDPPIRYDLSERDFRSFAGFLLTGSLLFSTLAKYDDAALGARLSKLGPGFLRTVKDPHERARALLVAAGLSAKAVWNLLDSAEAQRKVRENKKPAPVKGQRRSV